MTTSTRARPRARAAVLPFPETRRRRPGLSRLAPSGRSLLAGLAILAVAAGGYAGARESSLFAIRAVQVRGAPPAVVREVAGVLASFRGTSLLALDGAELERRVGALPDVERATYDRAFPHALRLVVVPERPVAVLRQGSDAWLVSARGRAMRRLPPHGLSALPRVWVPRSVQVVVGATLANDAGGLAVRALAPLAATRFPARVRFVRDTPDGLAFVLAAGVELRLGDPGDLPLKLAIARRILPGLAPASAGLTYLDVSVPQRPVSGTNPQVGTRG